MVSKKSTSKKIKKCSCNNKITLRSSDGTKKIKVCNCGNKSIKIKGKNGHTVTYARVWKRVGPRQGTGRIRSRRIRRPGRKITVGKKIYYMTGKAPNSGTPLYNKLRRLSSSKKTKKKSSMKKQKGGFYDEYVNVKGFNVAAPSNKELGLTGLDIPSAKAKIYESKCGPKVKHFMAGK